MEPSPGSNNKKIMAIVGLLVIVAAIGVGVTLASGKKADTTTASTMSTVPAASASPAVADASTSAAASSYKDGTYSATGSYDSPGGHESIKVSVTLKSGIISNTSATSAAVDPDGRDYQAQFIGAYKSQVVGKSIDQVSLSRVSGSSLTSQGFNSALAQIKSQAKS